MRRDLTLVFVSVFGLGTSLSASTPVAGTTERVGVDSTDNQGNSDSGEVTNAVSAEGRFVTFSSALVPGDTNDTSDIFVRDPSEKPLNVASAGDRDANRYPA